MESSENPPAAPPKRRPPAITKNTKFLSVTQMAERYSCSPDSIWRWASAGIVPAPVKFNPKVTRWNLDEVEARDAARAAARKSAAA